MVDMKAIASAASEALLPVKLENALAKLLRWILPARHVKGNAIVFFEMIIQNPNIVTVPRPQWTMTSLAFKGVISILF
jgi:hypothetical protein